MHSLVHLFPFDRQDVFLPKSAPNESKPTGAHRRLDAEVPIWQKFIFCERHFNSVDLDKFYRFFEWLSVQQYGIIIKNSCGSR
jgi:hypothetical protein